MITGLIVLEDITLKFDIPGSTEECKLVICDNMTGEQREVTCNNEQLGAIVGTSVCGTNEAVMTAAEHLVNQVFPPNWPSNLRPCP